MSEKKKSDPGAPAKPNFPLWKTIRLGTQENPEALRKAIVAKKNYISDCGSDILKRISVSPEEMELDLVKLTVGELGLPKGGTVQEIYAKAKELGLDLCPAEAGPQLRLQYQDQPSGEWVLIAMEPIADSIGYPCVFFVERNSVEHCLYVSYGHPVGFWGLGYVWVFAHRRRAS